MTRRTRWIAGIAAVVVLVGAGAGFAFWQAFGGDGQLQVVRPHEQGS